MRKKNVLCFSLLIFCFISFFSCTNADPIPGKKGSDIDTTSQKNNAMAEAAAYKLINGTGWDIKYT